MANSCAAVLKRISSTSGVSLRRSSSRFTHSSPERAGRKIRIASGQVLRTGIDKCRECQPAVMHPFIVTPMEKFHGRRLHFPSQLTLVLQNRRRAGPKGTVVQEHQIRCERPMATMRGLRRHGWGIVEMLKAGIPNCGGRMMGP